MQMIRRYDKDGKKNSLLDENEKIGKARSYSFNLESRNEPIEIGHKSDETVEKAMTRFSPNELLMQLTS